MIARFITLMLIVVLALPVATLPRPGDTSPSPWNDVAVAAKGKKHKKAKSKQPKSTTVTRTIRQPVTQTFTSPVPLTIPNGAPGTTKGPASAYPATIEVSGFSNGTITDVNLILDDLTHPHNPDLDILLSTGDGRQALVMSDAGADDDVTDIDLTLDDEAAAALSDAAAVTSGTFRPTNIDGSNPPDTFAAPAPAPNGSVALSVFDGADPNGTWQLWVMDDGINDVGDLGGWALEITAEADVQVVDQGKTKQHKKKGKKRR